jgi:hypothetical protein
VRRFSDHRSVRILSVCKVVASEVLMKIESHLEGVNRRNLKIMNFKHTLCPGLVLEIIQSVEDSSPC